jgi:Family of unknown function (DUF5330)
VLYNRGGTKLGVEMGLFIKAIIFGGVILAMPSPPPDLSGSAATDISAPSSSWSYISAAAETVADFKNFCERKPQVCVTAQYMAGSLEGKAKYSAKLVYEWASAEPAKPKLPNKAKAAVQADPIQTGSIDMHLKGTLNENSTLRMEDLVPEWHGTVEPEKG